jgi:hypothetical protein
VQLPHKIVHEELALQWLVLHGSARELAMANLWYVSVYSLRFAALSINLVLLLSSLYFMLSLSGVTVHIVTDNTVFLGFYLI